MPILTRADQGRQPTMKLKVQTLAQLIAAAPAATHEGHIAYVTNGNAGAKTLVCSDGVNWKVVALGATAS